MSVVARGVRVFCALAISLSAASASHAATNDTPAVAGGSTRLAMVTTVDSMPIELREPGVGETNVVYLKPARPAQGVSSAALAQQTWKAFEKAQFDQVIVLADQCVSRFAVRALRQQSLLADMPPREKIFNYSALNDTATCLFLKGKALRAFGRDDDAKAVFREIIRDYRFAQCWDPKGWFWKVAGAAQDQINCMDFDVDFGDYTSETLTAKAWKAYTARRYDAMELYVRKCIELFSADAKKMQATLSDYPAKGLESSYWALNDVATCLYIRGKALQERGLNKDAAIVYREILESYSFAQCYDPSGWYWKIADQARRNLQFCG